MAISISEVVIILTSASTLATALKTPAETPGVPLIASPLTVILQLPLLTLIFVLGDFARSSEAIESTGTKSLSLTVKENPELEPLRGN